MTPAISSTRRTRDAISIVFGTVIISVLLSAFVVLTLSVASAAAQTGDEFELRTIPVQAGFIRSEALGIARSGWEPLTMVGAMETTTGQNKATCWIYSSQQWVANELPGLDPNGNSRAQAVVHVPWTEGEYTVAAGVAEDAQGTHKPMTWCNVKNLPWTGHALPTLNGGDGEARGLFLPDGTPVRALYCGWAGETPPMTAGGAPRAAEMKIAVPAIWETTSVGERILRPDYGVGLAGQANDICSSGIDSFIAVGGGETSMGPWRPQVWMSVDDGETWQNSELPLPTGMERGEANACELGHELGHILLASGYGESFGGPRTPLLWEIDLSSPAPLWVVHELPLPAGTEGGENNYVRKRPGRLKFSGAVMQSGVAELAVWTDDSTGWIVELPTDYLVNPEAGTPITAAGIDASGHIAVTVRPPNPVAFPTSTTTDTMAAVLSPSPPTGVEAETPPRKFIAVTASPNPFNPRVRIGYTLPREGHVTVSIHDAAGRVVATFDEGYVPADVERAFYWDATTPEGDRTSSGIYFVRVATGFEIATAKIVLLK